MDEFAFGVKVNRVMSRMKEDIKTMMKGMDDPKLSMKSIRDGTVGMIGVMVDTMDSAMSLVSDMASATSGLKQELARKDEEMTGLKEQIRELEKSRDAMVKSRDSVELGASKKEMEDRLKVAMCQLKVMDVEIGKETEDRKEIVSGGLKWMREQVRTDLREEFDSALRRATVAPLVRKTVRKTHEDGTVGHGVPMLVTMPDRVSKWAVEDVLRKSKVHPRFHWPSEIMEFVTKVRGQVNDDLGIKESENYIRIRPEDRGGKILIRADYKPKTGNSRFLHKASWEVPPLNKDLWGRNKELFKPTLVK